MLSPNLKLHNYQFALILLIANCSFQQDSAIPPAPWTATEAFPRLKFDNPVDFSHANDGSGRLFVLEQEGKIQVFQNNHAVTSSSVFLDIKGKVSYGGETGLLGLAFHPNFKTNGYYFLNYTRKLSGKLETVIARYKVDGSNKNQTDSLPKRFYSPLGSRMPITMAVALSSATTAIFMLPQAMEEAVETLTITHKTNDRFLGKYFVSM